MDILLKDDIWKSKAFLGLPTDEARMAFLRFLSLADEAGDFRASLRFKTEDTVREIVKTLSSAGLVRSVEKEGVATFNIPAIESFCVRELGAYATIANGGR